MLIPVIMATLAAVVTLPFPVQLNLHTPVANWSRMNMAVAPAFRIAVICMLAMALASAQSVADATRKSNAANALVAAGKAEQAIPLLRELAAQYPNERAFGVNLAVALFKADHYRETIGECETLTVRWPDLFPAWMFLGAARLKMGDARSAESALRRALELQPNDPNARLMLADALSATEQWAEAAVSYELCARALPNNPRIVYGMARSYEALVWQAASQIVNGAPNSVEVLALSAELELEQGRVVQAFQQFRQALVLDPSFPGLHPQLAEIYKITGHSDWAAVEKAKEPPKGTCNADLQQCQFAAGQFLKIVAARPDSARAVYWQAKSFLALSRRAYAHLKEIRPPSRESYEAQAMHEEKLGRYPEAAAAWKSALQLDPSDFGLQKHLALALCHGNDCVTALPLLQQQLVREPNSAELNYLCGLALNSTRKPAEALPYLEAAVRLDGQFLPAHAVLGEAYLEAGKPEQAIPELKAAVAEDESGTRLYQLAHAYQAAGMHDESVAALRDYREKLSHRAADLPPDSAITPP